MTAEQEQEYSKCMESRYYFMTKYWTVNGEPFTTAMSENDFNDLCRRMEKPPLMKRRRHNYPSLATSLGERIREDLIFFKQ